MTQIAGSATGYLDTSSASLSQLVYTRAGNTEAYIDNSSVEIEQLNVMASGYTEGYIDQAIVKVKTHVATAGSAVAYLSNYKPSVATVATSAGSVDAFLDKHEVTLKTTVGIPGSTEAYISNSTIMVDTRIIAAGNTEGYVDNSSTSLGMLSRLFITDPPVGSLYVVVNGVDQEFKGFAFKRHNTYGVNVIIHGNRLSDADTSLKFYVKRNLSDSDEQAYFSKTTNDGITLQSVSNLSDTFKQYQAQLIFNRNDMVKLPAVPKTIKLFYELRLVTSLNEEYCIEQGVFTVG